MKTVLLLTLSSTFMNLAWYGHLKLKDQPLWIVILVSWGIALVVFSLVAYALFRTPIRWNIGVSYALNRGRGLFCIQILSEARRQESVCGGRLGGETLRLGSNAPPGANRLSTLNLLHHPVPTNAP